MSQQKLDRTAQITTPDELGQYSQALVSEFLGKASFDFPLDIGFSSHATWESYKAALEKAFPDSVFCERSGDRLVIHLCEEGLQGIPVVALQGWLERELALAALELHPELFAFKFSELIVPLFPVAGSAEYIVHNMVEDIQVALKRYMATKTVIDLDSGLPQVHLYFYTITPDAEDVKHYEKSTTHSWVRGLFLCRKLREFMLVHLLTSKGLSAELKSYWWRLYDYISTEDRSLLEELCLVPEQHAQEPYAAHVVEIFKKIKNCLLVS